MSQIEIALLLKCSDSTIRFIESGKRFPTRDIIKAICKLYKTSPNWWLLETKETVISEKTRRRKIIEEYIISLEQKLAYAKQALSLLSKGEP
jgi:transcriptional regulator with XRE-family HTH domain